MMPVLVQREVWERRAEYLWIPLIVAVLGLLPSAFVASQWELFQNELPSTLVIAVGEESDIVEGILGQDDGEGEPLSIDEVPDALLDDDVWDFHQRWQRSGRDLGLSEELLSESFSIEEEVDEKLSLNSVSHGLFLAFLALWIFVASLYLLDALYRERRDRSLLFWQSMPVPEWQVVIAKLLSAWVGTSLVFWVASWVPQWVLVWTISEVAGDGLRIGTDYSVLQVLYEQISLLATLWFMSLPLACWLLLVSSRATKMPMLWAFLIPAVLAVAEFWLFSSTHVWQFIVHSIPTVMFEDMKNLTLFTAGTGSIVAGTVMSAAAIAGAIYYRRQAQ
ncbi:hypothetical protein CHH28_14735 [Bacterioplanes sanyensis]|uniref:Uncharacterized protein n=1 Tax=Bacterioplanes sanyensis TaxID=1249553 RepID=A0A222FNQ9_9GAMM|nr:hypothetical protein [Bacterioplanes sanyensis]ASP39853.1 hypothetical protein CHH28_14735 [Bacterioplanes sanyensis]